MTTAREALELMNKMADAWWGGVGTADWTDFRKVHEYLISALRDSLPAVQEEPDTHPIHLTEDAYYELLGYRADCLLRKSKEESAARAVEGVASAPFARNDTPAIPKGYRLVCKECGSIPGDVCLAPSRCPVHVEEVKCTE